MQYSLNDHSVFSIMARVGDEIKFSSSQLATDFTMLQEAQEVSRTLQQVTWHVLIHQQEFYNNGTGPYTAPTGITNGFQRLSEQELFEIGAGAVVEAGLADQSHIEYLFESTWYPPGPTPYYKQLSNESYISLTTSSMVALSRGNVTLKGTSMAMAPNINPNVSDLNLSSSLKASLIVICSTILMTRTAPLPFEVFTTFAKFSLIPPCQNTHTVRTMVK
jgi:hypothetical protein